MTRERELVLIIAVPFLLWALFIGGTALYRGASLASAMLDPGIPMLLAVALLIGWNLLRYRRRHRDE